jgi:uracil-DNA glycosylase
VGSQTLDRLAAQIIECRKCPRLVRYREAVARRKRAAFRDWTYWGRPVPGFGDPGARLLIVGLAPAAHGGNRTGRVFTGDRSGDWLYRALHRAGFANQATAVSRDDGLILHDCYIAAAVRCAPPGNRPTPVEFARCRPFLEEEIRLLPSVRVVITLGGTALAAFLRAWGRTGHEIPRPRPRLRHAAIWSLPPAVVVTSYHPSQRNTSTKLLTESMLDDIFRLARSMIATTHQESRTGAR